MLCIVLGTRPEIIKCAPIIFEAQARGLSVGIIHTGQHYSSELDGMFFQELNLPHPVAHAHVGSHPAARQIGIMVQRLSDIFHEIRPSAVIVEGDTNTVLAGALAAYKAGIPVAHLEAGLRSDDWDMPEEANRVLTDRISRWLFAPTAVQRERLLEESIPAGRIHVVGNTIVDASLHFAKIAYAKSDIAERLGVTNKPYALLTLHRPSNVDKPERLRALIAGVGEALRRHGLVGAFPVHPRTADRLSQAGVSLDAPFLPCPPLGYLDLLRLQSSADIVLTDSGGIQEEACTLRVPCVTLRANTERPETVTVGASALHHDPHPDALTDVIRKMRSVERTWEQPFGDGRTAARVLDILTTDITLHRTSP